MFAEKKEATATTTIEGEGAEFPMIMMVPSGDSVCGALYWWERHVERRLLQTALLDIHVESYNFRARKKY